MSFLYRFAVTISRKQPYVDWANSFDDGVELTLDTSHENRTVYLVPETTNEPDAATILDEYWDWIFELELSAWMTGEESWPADRTRQMFTEWFDVEVTSGVYDLAPDEPLTPEEVDAIDLETALGQCAWCEIDLVDGAGRLAGFKVVDRDRLAGREGRPLPIPIEDDRVVFGIVASHDSEAARAGQDLVFRACSSRCERALRSAVPKALKKMFLA